MKIYSIKGVDQIKNGIIQHHVLTANRTEEDYYYLSVRIGLVWPTMESNGYFVVGGMEYDKFLSKTLRPTLRIIQDEEIQGLSLDSLCSSVTDSYLSTMCEHLYVDYQKEDYKLKLWDYLDRMNLRNISVLDVPYRDVVLRFSLLRDFNDSGVLVIDKSSPLYEDMKGISKEHLKDNPESKWFRLNALSFLISGFEKFKAVKPLNVSNLIRGNVPSGLEWMER